MTLLSALAAVGARQLAKTASWPAGLQLTVFVVPVALVLIGAILFFLNLWRDIAGKVMQSLEAGVRVGQRGGLVREALHLGSPAWSVCFVMVSFAAYSLGQIDGMPQWLRLTLAVAPIVPLALYLGSIGRDKAAVDELALRVRHEAYGFAFHATIGLLVCFHLLESAGVIKNLTLGTTQLIVGMLALLVVGAAISGRRYR